MQIVAQNKPTLWGSLLWKDFQQVKIAFVVLTGGTLSMQLMFLLIDWLTQDQTQGSALLQCHLALASITPILLAIACSGMLIGHERQSGNWAWSSGLPVSWLQALCSKLLVATLGAFCVSLPLGIIPAVLLLSQKMVTTPVNISATYYTLSLVVLLQVVVVCFLATVLMRNTLGALIASGFALTVLHAFSSLPWLDEKNWLSWVTDGLGIARDSVPLVWFAFLSTSILTVGLLLLFVAFRWRWTYGQQSKLEFWQDRASSTVIGSFHYRVSDLERPKEWWVMLVHSFRSYFGMGLCILATWVICALTLTQSPWGLNVTFAFIATLGLGVIAFQSDQTLGRFRFLADRGASPWKLVLSRLSIAAIFTVPVFLCFLLSTWNPLVFFHDEFLLLLFVIPILFATGALASLCFPRPLIAIGAALLILVVGATVNVAMVSWVRFDQQILVYNGFDRGSEAFERMLICCFPIGGLFCLISIFRLSHRWLVLDKPKLELHFFWISTVALLSPFCIACTFGFLSIPIVPAIERQVDSASVSERLLPNYLSLSEPLLVDSLPDIAVLSHYRSGSMHMIQSCAQGVVGTIRNEIRETQSQSISELITPSLTKLDEIQLAPRVPATNELWLQLNRLIVRTAALATAAVGDKDLELRLWRLNRQLQDIGSEVFPLETQDARKIAMYLLLGLNNTEVELIGEPEVYRSLIPAVSDERTPGMEVSLASEQSIRQLLKENSAKMSLHWIAVTRYYPPMRWFYERQLARDFYRERSYLATAPKNYLTAVVRDQLKNRFP